MPTAPHRLTPPGQPQDYETWGIRPALRAATCEEVACSAHAHGWRSRVRRGSPEEGLLRQAALGQVDGHRRHFIEIDQPDGMVEFLFEPGQPCLKVATHEVPAEREGLYLRRGGDWRAQTAAPKAYDRPDQWTDDLHTVTTKRQELKERHG
jgi:hypothetical protein